MQIIFTISLIILPVLLTGCNSAQTLTETTETLQGQTTLSGRLTATSADKATLQQTDGTLSSLESYSVDFTEYSGQTVDVTGEYSGPVLFVDEISTIGE